MKKNITTVIIVVMGLVAMAWLTSKDETNESEAILHLQEQVTKLSNAQASTLNQQSLWVNLSNQNVFNGTVATQLVAIAEQAAQVRQALSITLSTVNIHTKEINAMLSNRYNLK